MIIEIFEICGCSSAWLERRTVTAEVAGSNPVARAFPYLYKI